jgi:hypothetical protein
MASSSIVSILDSLSLPCQGDVISLFADEQITGACLEYLEKALAAVEQIAPPKSQPLMLSTSPDSSASPVLSPACPDMNCVNLASGAISGNVSTGGGVMMCLASVLEALADFDERTVFSVRKINKLGFKSHSVLRKYFSNFGVVEAIFFLPYRYKPDTASIRPSSMAFVRMASRAAVEAVFTIGEVHIVRDVPVTVQPFTRTASSA